MSSRSSANVSRSASGSPGRSSLTRSDTVKRAPGLVGSRSSASLSQMRSSPASLSQRSAITRPANLPLSSSPRSSASSPQTPRRGLVGSRSSSNLTQRPLVGSRSSASLAQRSADPKGVTSQLHSRLIY